MNPASARASVLRPSMHSAATKLPLVTQLCTDRWHRHRQKPATPVSVSSDDPFQPKWTDRHQLCGLRSCQRVGLSLLRSCGAALATTVTCPSCGRDNPAAQRFCNHGRQDRIHLLVLDNSAVGWVSCTPSFLRLLRCWLAHSRPRAGPTTDSSPAAKARLTHRTTGLPSG